VNPLREFVEAYYGGVPGQKAPETDSDQLRAIADLLDRCDDIADRLLMRKAVQRDMQVSLRRIADNIEGLRWEGPEDAQR